MMFRSFRSALALALVLTCVGSLSSNRAAGAGIVFDGSPGSGAAPATLGGYTMTPFPLDTRFEYTLVTDIPAPAGSITLSSPVYVQAVGSTVNVGQFAGGTYSGKVYWTGGSNVASLTITLPTGTRAFSFYLTPFACGTFMMQATVQDGTTSGPTPVTTTCGFGGQPTARYFGFYATGSEEISSVVVALVDSSTPYQTFLFGDFGISVVSDTSAPLITASVSPAPNGNGWNNTGATVTWSVSDPESGIAATANCDASTIGSETAGSVLTCSATNGAGLTTAQSVTVRVDTTAPLISFTGNAGTYTVDQTISITCTASDSLSGLASNGCADVSGPAYAFPLGASTSTASASDNAGNGTSASTTLTVTVTPGTLCLLTKQFVQSSPKYLALPRVAQAQVIQLANAVCTKVTVVAPHLPPTHKAAAIAAYQRGVDALVSAGWLSSAQATILKALAGAL